MQKGLIQKWYDEKREEGGPEYEEACREAKRLREMEENNQQHEDTRDHVTLEHEETRRALGEKIDKTP